MRNADGTFAVGSRHLVKHGKAASKIYLIWNAMRQRCGNPSVAAFKDYGARGIKVCERWEKFENFYADMGDRPDGMTLDRIDNNKGYSPENCRWASRVVQARNKRGLHMLTVGGETRALCEWAEVTGIAIGTLWSREKLGWAAEDIIGKPIRFNPRFHGAEQGVVWTEPKEKAA